MAAGLKWKARTTPASKQPLQIIRNHACKTQFGRTCNEKPEQMLHSNTFAQSPKKELII
jgi:hypothetical protein